MMRSKLALLLLIASLSLFPMGNSDRLEVLFALQDEGDLPAALDEAFRLMNVPEETVDSMVALVYSQLLLDLGDLSAPLDGMIGASSSKELGDYIKFNLARIFMARGMPEKALEQVETIRDGTPGAYFRYRLLREKAAIYGRLKLHGKEALAWSEIGAIENLGKQKKKEALFREAAAWQLSGAEARAKRMYRAIAFDLTPNPFGSRALKAYTAMGAEDYPPADQKQKEELIDKLLNCGRTGDALDLYKTFPKEKESSILLTQILYRARKNDELFCLADEVLKKSGAIANGDRGTVLKALWATLRTNDADRAASYFKWLGKNLPKDHKLFLENSYAMGCFHYVNGRFAEAVPLFEAVKADKKGQFYRNALYKSALSSIALGKGPEGLLAPLLEEKDGFRERSLYVLKKWYSLEAEGDPIPAGSYYSAVSDREFAKKTAAAVAVFRKRLFSGKIDRNSLIYDLHRAGLPLFALDQLEKRGQELAREDAITRMMLLSEIGELCFEFPSDFDYRVGLSHPTPWRKEIMLAAREEGVDPALMFAIARRESRFDPLAFSSVGAVGLFQLMPETARKISGIDVSEEDLLDPLTNARIAARYMKQLAAVFPMSARIAASYNAGEDVVSVWSKSFGEEETLFVLLVPYFETQGYAEGVLFDKAVYTQRLSN